MMCEDTKEYNGHTYSGVLLGACIDGYEQGKADERARVLTQFLFELGKNVAYEKEKVFGTDVIRIDALMTICHEIEEQLNAR